MRSYLVQHAEAMHEEEDKSRPLSKKGWEDIRRVAKYAEEYLHIRVGQIVHSGKLRAKQTTEVLAEHLRPEKGVVAAEGLDPLADPSHWKKRLAETMADTMIVGHLPHLSRLSGLLLCEDESKGLVAFKMGGIICLEREEGGRWTIQWVITPEIIP